MDTGNHEHTQWPSVSVLVLNWNGRSLLPTCLSPLLQQDYPTFEVVLIDNASEDDSVAYVKANFPQVRLIQNETNLGFSRGINVGLRRVKSDVVILLNNDVVVQPGWLRALVRPMMADASIGVAGCKLLFPDGRTIQHLGGRLDYPLAYSHHDYGGEPDKGQVTAVCDVDYVTGAAMAITRETLTEIGQLDENFAPFYYEEVDFCTRARAAGRRVVVAPDAVALHDESTSMKQVRGLKLHTFHKNRLRYVLKHYDVAQFLDDFVPAETARLQQPATVHDYEVMRRVYLETAVAAASVLAQRNERDQLPAIQAALLQLRETALAQDAGFYEPDLAGWPANELVQRQVIEEPEFRSPTPIIGPLLARLRQLWNSVATKWYVRGVIQQQMTFNRLAARLLAEQHERAQNNAREIDWLLAELLQAQQKQTRLEQKLSQLKSLSNQAPFENKQELNDA